MGSGVAYTLGPAHWPVLEYCGPPSNPPPGHLPLSPPPLPPLLRILPEIVLDSAARLQGSAEERGVPAAPRRRRSGPSVLHHSGDCRGGQSARRSARHSPTPGAEPLQRAPRPRRGLPVPRLGRSGAAEQHFPARGQPPCGTTPPLQLLAPRCHPAHRGLQLPPRGGSVLLQLRGVALGAAAAGVVGAARSARPRRPQEPG